MKMNNNIKKIDRTFLFHLSRIFDKEQYVLHVNMPCFDPLCFLQIQKIAHRPWFVGHLIIIFKRSYVR